jgi:S1-C subfamily serine protease
LVTAISSYRYGTEITLTVQRNVNGKYEEIIITATLGQRSEIVK